MKMLLAVGAVLCVASCSQKTPPDPICRIEALPETSDGKAGQGAIRIVTPASDYFYVSNSDGKQIGSASTDAMFASAPGFFTIKLEGSSHKVAVQAKMITRCEAGALVATGPTDQYFYVMDVSGKQLASAALNKAVPLFPGTYSVRVNNTKSVAEVQPSKIAELKTGTLTVPGQTDEYYYVLDSAGTQLASAHLGAPLSLLPGSWTVKLNNTSASANLAAGSQTELRPGELVVRGQTDEYYYVFNPAGTQLASTHLDRPLSLFPGSYTVKLNTAPVPVKIAAGTTTEYRSGWLTLRASANEYYYVLNREGVQIASARVGRSLSLPAGEYQVKLGQETRPVLVTESREAVVTW